MSEIILHNYPQSPVSEKVRKVFGIKDLAWRSVQIPRMPPKPDLMPLTGGFRMTPVMQVGADVFCDSSCIIRAIEHLHPLPTLFPGGADGMAWGVAQWTDGPMFKAAIAMVFGDQVDQMPADFSADRGPFYFGDNYDAESLKAELAENVALVRAQLEWMDQRLATGRPFILGPEPGLPDAFCHYLVWFIRGRCSMGPGLLAQFDSLLAWEERMGAIGSGRPEDMDAVEALDIARDSTHQTPERADADDPQGLAPGDSVAVGPSPSGMGSGPAVAGRVISVSAQEIVIVREHERVGEVAVHFPRVGSRVTKVST